MNQTRVNSVIRLALVVCMFKLHIEHINIYKSLWELIERISGESTDN